MGRQGRLYRDQSEGVMSAQNIRLRYKTPRLAGAFFCRSQITAAGTSEVTE
jgi:hypothetical protein